MMKRLGPMEKAFEVNLDSNLYGTFAEIGAGQEVARQFFRAGGAAGTIAKSISAYDMVVSDLIYGRETSGRYVCEPRLLKMLEREYNQITERLCEKRGPETCFFAFANTVAAKSFKNKEGHGWLGVRFRHPQHKEPSQVIVHIQMEDRENLQQQEILGVVGVNLIYAALLQEKKKLSFFESFIEGLNPDRLTVDMIRVEGEAFSQLDSRLLCLELVENKFCQAVMFDKNGGVIHAPDACYKKNILACRGSYRPPTLVNTDMLKCGKSAFIKDLPEEERSSTLVLPEISMNKLRERGKVDNHDFLARVDLLGAIGHPVLITNFDGFHDLSRYIAKLCRRQVSFVMGVYNLEDIFQLERYEGYPTGILGGLGILFGQKTKLYVYPSHDDKDRDYMITMENISIDERLTYLYLFLIERGFIEDLHGYDKSYAGIWSRKVLKQIQSGEKGWEKHVPEAVAMKVKNEKLFKV